MANILIQETMCVHYLPDAQLKRLKVKIEEYENTEVGSKRFRQLQKQINKYIEKIQYNHHPVKVDFVYEKY